MSEMFVKIEYDESYGSLTLEEIEKALYDLYAPGGGFRVTLAAQHSVQADLPYFCAVCGSRINRGHAPECPYKETANR